MSSIRGPARLRSPTFQLWNAAGEQARDKTREAHFGELLTHTGLHFLSRDIRQHKLSALKAVTAKNGALRSVGIRAAALFIALERHPAALTVFVRFVHGGQGWSPSPNASLQYLMLRCNSLF